MRAFRTLALASAALISAACTTVNVITAPTTTTSAPAKTAPGSLGPPESFRLAGGNMEPTLQIGSEVTVTPSQNQDGIKRGDVVVFRSPPAENCGGPPVADDISRVIGLPGETISLSTSPKDYVKIDGKQLDETWLPSSLQGITFPGPAGTPYNLDNPYLIPDYDYYVMGDNRTDSCDSRYWGPVPFSDVVGVAR